MKLRNATVTVLTALTVSISATIRAESSSLPGYNSSYWYTKHTVKIKKPVNAYQINPRSWETRNKKILRANTKITIFNSANLSWVVSSNKLHKINGYTWVIKGHYNTRWLK